MANPHPNQAGLWRGRAPGQPRTRVKPRPREDFVACLPPAQRARGQELLAFLTAVAESAEWQANVWQRVLAGKAPHIESYLLMRIAGRPVEKIEHSGPDGAPIREIHHYLTRPEPALEGEAEPVLIADVSPD